MIGDINCHAIEPIFSKSAKIVSDITLDTYLGYYHGRTLEEIEKFNAYELLFDFTIPVFQDAQVRLTWPAYTKGDAKIRGLGDQSTHVKGYGGTYEFFSLALEYQLNHVGEQNHNLLVYGALGKSMAYLDTSHKDRLNHTGKLAKLGLRYDRVLAPYNSNIFAVLEFRQYWDSDDLNPGDDNGTSFSLMNFSGAWLWQNDSSFDPLVELRYSSDFDNYHAISVVPELIHAINPIFDLKFGIPIGLSDDADSYGAILELTTQF